MLLSMPHTLHPKLQKYATISEPISPELPVTSNVFVFAALCMICLVSRAGVYSPDIKQTAVEFGIQISWSALQFEL